MHNGEEPVDPHVVYSLTGDTESGEASARHCALKEKCRGRMLNQIRDSGKTSWDT